MFYLCIKTSNRLPLLLYFLKSKGQSYRLTLSIVKFLKDNLQPKFLLNVMAMAKLFSDHIE